MTTKTAKHTPGPWYINAYRREASDTVTGSRYALDSKPETADLINIDSTNGAVCSINRRSYTNASPAIGDARLIAAAPELLAACKRQRELIDAIQDVIRSYLPPDGISQEQAIDEIIQLTDNPDERQLDSQSRAAIAKAEGGAP